MKDNHIDYSDYYENGGKVDKTIPLKIRKEIYDNEGERRIDERAIEVLTDYAENLPQTKDLNTSKRTGQYYPERQKLHRKIIDSFKKDLICIQNDEPIAILMGGSPASGKSTFLRKYAPYLLKEEILKVDADDIPALVVYGRLLLKTGLDTKLLQAIKMFTRARSLLPGELEKEVSIFSFLLFIVINLYCPCLFRLQS